MKTSNQLSESPRAPDRVGCDGSGSAQSWKVHVTVCGTNAGDYECATFEEAKKMSDERNAKWSVLGCHYRLIAPANECPHCGKPGEYIRTRQFETENADVWECVTLGCVNHRLLFHTRVLLPQNASDEPRPLGAVGSGRLFDGPASDVK